MGSLRLAPGYLVQKRLVAGHLQLAGDRSLERHPSLRALQTTRHTHTCSEQLCSQ